MVWNMWTIKAIVETFADILYGSIPLVCGLVLCVIWNLFHKQIIAIGDYLSEHAVDVVGISLFLICFLMFIIMEKTPFRIVAISCITLVFMTPYTIHWHHAIKEKKDKKYWIEFHKKYGIPVLKLSIPMTFYGDFEAKFWLHDEHGNVKDSAKTQSEAIMKHEKTGLYITKIIEKYPVEE